MSKRPWIPQDGNSTSLTRYVFCSSLLHVKRQFPQRLTFLSWWEIEVMFRSVRMWVTSFGTTKTVAPPKRLCNVHSLCNKRRTRRYVYAGICMHIIWTVSTHAPFVPDAPLQPRQGMRVLSIIANPISVKKSNRNITRKYSLQFSAESLLLKDLVLHCPYT